MDHLKPKLRAALQPYIENNPVPQDSVIAGGAICNTILNLLHDTNLPINDVDIYTFVEQLPEENVEEYGYANTVVYAAIDKIHLILSKMPEKLNHSNKIYNLIRRFNINAVQVAYDWHNDVLYYTKDFLSFLSHRKLLLNPRQIENVTMNVIKLYQKHQLGVGVLNNEYLTSVYSDETIPYFKIPQKYQGLFLQLKQDPQFTISEWRNGGIHIGANNIFDKFEFVRNSDHICMVANELALYGNISYNTKVALKANLIRTYTTLATIDIDYWRNKLVLDNFIKSKECENLMWEFSHLIYFREIPIVVQLLQLLRGSSNLYLETWNTYLVQSNYLQNLQELLKDFSIISNKQITPNPPLFKNQVSKLHDVATIKKFSLYDLMEISSHARTMIKIPGCGFIKTSNFIPGAISWSYYNPGLRCSQKYFSIVEYLRWYGIIIPDSNPDSTEFEIPF